MDRRSFIGIAAALAVTPALADDRKICMTGFLGNVAQHLHFAGYPLGKDYGGIDKKNGPEFDLANTGAEARWSEQIYGCRTVIHLAATPGGDNHVDLQRNNFLALANLFDECVKQRVGRVIFASSILASPGSYQKPGEGVYPSLFYGWSKRYAEALAKSLASERTSFVGIRFGWVPTLAQEASDLASADPWTLSVRSSGDDLRVAFDMAGKIAPSSGFALLESFRGKLKQIG